MKEIFTVGHSTLQAEEFIEMLRAHSIELLADVRRFPGSRKFPWFGKDRFPQLLKDAGIDYRHYEELGGRRTPLKDSPHTEWRNSSFRGYDDYMDTAAFLTAVEQLEQVAADKRTALMCSEAVWWRCHRGMLSDFLKDRGWTVWHIMNKSKKDEHPYTTPARQKRLF